MHFILLGPPGSGKGTQGEYLERKIGATRLSTGDLLREEIKNESNLGNLAKSAIESGKLVSDDIVFAIIESRLAALMNSHFILDGFPRNLQQAQWLTSVLDRLHIKIDHVLNFSLEDDLIIERISSRYFCSKCKTTYNKLFHNPKIAGVCDVCGEREFLVRPDDKAEVVKKRLIEYSEQTQPLIAYYKNQGILNNIDASGNISDVREKIDVILAKSR